MKLGWGKRISNIYLTAWKSPDDPGTGGFSFKMDMQQAGFHQLFLYKGDVKWWRAGSWTGQRLTGVPEMTSTKFIFNITYVDDSQSDEVFVSYSLNDTSGGCRRKPGVSPCHEKGEGFVKLGRVKVPDTSDYVHMKLDMDLGLKECEEACLSNCLCLAYASGNAGQDLYVRVDAAELAAYAQKNSKSNGAIRKRSLDTIIDTIIVPARLLLLFPMEKTRGKDDVNCYLSDHNASVNSKGMKETGKVDVTFFELRTILAATQNFSSTNKLGQGGFGPIYKGKLANGQEIAVKRLSITSSGQGVEEFKNEVLLIAKLQHRNLVKLLGCCVEENEKMLIYEFMPNKSLDFFIFDESRKQFLDWKKRFDINLARLYVTRICIGWPILYKIRCLQFWSPIIGDRKRQEELRNLIKYAWELWSDEKALEIVDSSLANSFHAREALRCIQVGLLCVQDRATNRPSMSTIIFMLSSNGSTTDLPSPKQPTFSVRRVEVDTDYSSTTGTKSSDVNEVTITALTAR
ncbi:hypothetical protein OROMI_022961 [Orobanche minor]